MRFLPRLGGPALAIVLLSAACGGGELTSSTTREDLTTSSADRTATAAGASPQTTIHSAEETPRVVTSGEVPQGDVGGAVVLERVAVADADPFGAGGTALTLLVPEQWTVTGGPVWRHDRANLVTGEVVVSSPDGLNRVEFLPIFAQVWQDGGLLGFGIGDNYLGATVRPPINDPLEFLEQLVLPASRVGLVYEVVAREQLPGVVAASELASPGRTVTAERILVRYPFDEGPDLLEEFTIALRSTPNPGVPGLTNWQPTTLFALQALEPEFEARRPLLEAIAHSPVLDREWYTRYLYVLDLSIRNGLQSIEAAGRTSRIIAQLSEETFEIYQESYLNTQATNDRLASEFSQVIRGVDTYSSPLDTAGVQLPSGYDQVFGSSSGNVILSNDPAFDPATAFPLETWELLRPKR